MAKRYRSDTDTDTAGLASLHMTDVRNTCHLRRCIIADAQRKLLELIRLLMTEILRKLM